MAKKVKTAKLEEASKTSHMRRQLDPETQQILDKLRKLFSEETKNKFAIGDQIAILIERKGWKISDLAHIFKRKRNTLSEIYHTAITFSPDKRDFSIAFAHYELAYRAFRRFAIDPDEALREIEEKGINQRRQATRHFATKVRIQDNADAAESAAWSQIGSDVINRCFNEDCRAVVERLDSHSVAVVWLDAPYGKYGRYKNTEHNKGGAAIDQADGMATEEVVELLDDLMRVLIDKISDGGVLLICRPGGVCDPLHSTIVQFAQDYGWDIFKILTWNKGTAKLGSGKEPYTFDSESIWVLHGDGGIVNHDGSSMKTVLDFSPVIQRSINAEESHLFAKPVDLCKFMINKHSYEGELVFDACGCTGSFCVAAIELNRKFVYAESNEKNYQMGIRSISQAHQRRWDQAG